MHEGSHEPDLRLGPANAAVPTTEETPALYLPIWALTEAHIGRKIRTEGRYAASQHLSGLAQQRKYRALIARVLAFDVASSHLLLASSTDPFEPQAPIRTVLVSTKVALSGQSPAAKDVSAARDGVNPRQLGRGSWERRYEPPRLSLDRGCWITVVGWLDAASAGRSRKVSTGSAAGCRSIGLKSV